MNGLNELEKAIQYKFNTEMAQVEEACDPENTSLMYALRAVETLPEHLRHRVQTKIANAKAHCQQQQDSAKKTAGELLSDKIDVATILHWCKQNRSKSQHKAGLSLIQQRLQSKAQSCKDATEARLMEHRPEEVIHHIIALFDSTRLDTYIPALTQIRDEVSDVVQKMLSKWLQELHWLSDTFETCLASKGIFLPRGGVGVHRILRAVVLLLPLLDVNVSDCI